MPSDNVEPSATPTEKSWTDAESEAAFGELGDRLIDATRRFLRSNQRVQIQASLYTMNGRELSRTQVAALEVVEREGSVRMSQLAARLTLDPSTVTRTIDPLVELDLIERFADPSNRRYVMVRCTPSGTDAVVQIAEGRRRVMREVLAPMEPGRRLLLAELLDEYTTLIEGVGAAADSPGD